MAKNNQKPYSSEDIALLLSDKSDKAIARELKRTPYAVMQKRCRLRRTKLLPPSTTNLPAVKMAAKVAVVEEESILSNQVIIGIGGKMITAEKDGLEIIDISNGSVTLKYK